MTGLCDLGVVEAAAAVRAGDVSPVELVEACLERIEAADATINAFIAVAADEALAEARERERLLSSGDDPGPLHGVPIAVKDNIETRAVPTTAGSAILAGHVPDRDAPVVRALRAAGAVVIGKTNLHEFAWGVTTENPHHGATRNPWDAARFVSGSSGGSAAAVASRMVPGALGTDTGGSICLPAAMCGAVGLRPTIGRVSTGGTIPLAWSMDTVGPMARSALDCAAVFDVIATGGRADATAWGRTPSTACGDVAGLTAGIPAGFARSRVQDGVREAFDAAVEVLEACGMRTVDVELADVDAIRSPWLTVMLVEASAYHAGWLRSDPDLYGDDVRTLLEIGAAIRAVDYVQAQRFRSLVRDELLATLDAVDVLLMPTAPFTATPVGARTAEIAPGDAVDVVSDVTRFACLSSAAGLPSLSLPCGFDADGLPIGLQVVGRPCSEDLLCGVGRAYQEATDWHLRAPGDPISAPHDQKGAPLDA
ncbi:MAG TPA: amidase [Capillimicrobium sp.]|nr:amidase [Capillimicrobium sp.]